jgi:hypothetical protein
MLRDNVLALDKLLNCFAFIADLLMTEKRLKPRSLQMAFVK